MQICMKRQDDSLLSPSLKSYRAKIFLSSIRDPRMNVQTRHYVIGLI